MNNLIVLDTNCLISALLTPLSTNKKVFDKILIKGQFIFSKSTFEELGEVMMRPKFDKYVSLEDRLNYLNLLEAHSSVINVHSDFQICRDVKDNKFLNLAFDANATCIVSGDSDLLVLNPFQNIPILSPADFLKL